MKKKAKRSNFLSSLVLLAFLVAGWVTLFTPVPVSALIKSCSDGTSIPDGTPEDDAARVQWCKDNNHGGTQVCDETGKCDFSVYGAADVQSTPFYKKLVTYINLFSTGIGILAVLSLVIAGIQYTAAQDNPQSIAAAKERITNVVIGIVLYVAMYGLLQWLIPGGIFN